MTDNFHMIPGEFQALDQWILWRGADRIDKKTGEIIGLEKIPCTTQGKNASSTNPRTWTTFKRAITALPVALEEWEAENPAAYRGGGIGFVFTPDDPYCGIDLDHCLHADGTMEPWATMILGWCDSYAERTPSGEGLHVLIKAAMPDGKGRKYKKMVECYSRGRFFTMTGDHWASTPLGVNDRQEALERILAWIAAQEEQEKKEKKPRTKTEKPALPPAPMSDSVLLTRAVQARNGSRFQALWGGDTSMHGGDDSVADAALCSQLAFWTRDPAQIDRLFRMSGLMRDKWDERHGEGTYGERTINFALSHVNGHAPELPPPTAPVSHPPMSLPEEPPDDPAEYDDGWITAPPPVEETPPPQARIAPPIDISWRESLIMNDKKGTPQENMHNILLFLRHLPEFDGLWWDTFRGMPMRHKLPVTENYALQLISTMSQVTRMSINNFRNFLRCVHAVCHQTEIDPLQDFLQRLPPWDNTPRIEHFFPAYTGSPDIPFTRWAGLGFWCQLVQRIRTPGSQARSVVILHGRENTGKSALCRAIGSPWASTLEQGLDHKEAQMRLRGVLVMELPELGSFSKTEERHIKSFITLTEDAYILKYSNDTTVIPRRTVFIGTTNERACLPSVHGNTRFNPIDTTTVRYEECERDRDQMLAEAALYLDHKYRFWEEPPGINADAERDARRIANVYENSLHEWLIDRPPSELITWELIAEKFLLIENKERWKDVALQKQIAGAMRSLGYESVVRHTPMKNGERRSVRYWKKDDESVASVASVVNYDEITRNV